MRLAEDRRARIPFALVGVLLLVTSAAFATTLSTREPIREDRAVETTMDRTDANAATALRSAVSDAAEDAAREPVIEPAATPAGRTLNDTTPFRDALRVRIYLAARSELEAAGHRRGEVVASASLPPVDDAVDLRAAKRRVEVEPVANGTALRVVVRDVRKTARREGRLVADESETFTVTVATPVLALHDRTEAYERRLNRGPLDGPGLGRQLTARLYPVVWARGYGQYGGAPIENVLANRHVELSTNGGALWTQRAVFGRSDPAGRVGLDRATARIGAQDLLAPTPLRDEDEWADAVLARPNGPVDDEPIPRFDPADSDAPEPEGHVSVGVNRSADVAFAEFVEEGGENSFEGALRGSYRAEVELRTAVTRTRDGREPPRRPPGKNWTLVDERTDERTIVFRPADGGGRTSPADTEAETFETHTREVVVHHEAVRTWRKGNETRERRAGWDDRYRVTMALTGAYRPTGNAPSAPTSPTFERGGALSGPNLEDVPDGAHEALVDENGGPDGVARRAVDGSLDDASATVYGDRPDRLSGWAYEDAANLRDRVRNVSVRSQRGEIAAGEANPPAALAATLRERRAELLDAPETYDGAAERARIAARAAYLDRVIAALDARAERTDEANGRIERATERAGGGLAKDIRRTLDARKDAVRSERRDAGSGGRGGPTGPTAFVPDGGPAYLTLSSVEGQQVESLPSDAEYRPFATRNVNVFTVPTDDAADGVAEAAFSDEDLVDLATAGRALTVANRTLAATDDDALRTRRDRLRGEVDDSLAVVGGSARTSLAREPSLSPRERRAAVSAGFERWNDSGHRAIAATNGSLARSIAAEAAARGDLSERRADRLGVRLRVELGRAARSDDARVPASPTNRTATTTRELGRKALKKLVAEGAENATERAKDRWLGDALVSVPAGLPVAPVPGYWYATTNVWTVTVRGEYHEFAVRARAGPPDGGGATARYVRDGSTAALDVDGDGEEEPLGRNERVSFETRTTVVVAVPAGGTGVGDVDGDADERSSGWPTPGCEPGGGTSEREGCDPE
ncbi:DUF7286 family protein [Halegenticoccus tardaugens]|uniref:DUF7286 family protein n=1 Tax=Halegenticoccus tardaugens TaxID=2071624 RepID=UPI0013E8F62C|nr:hypothetical protein [Halegenticoccus tardaugens]